MKSTKFKKGKSGNPKGINASNFGEMIRNHPKTLDLVQMCFDIALDPDHKNQMRATSLLMDRIAPQLKASELKIEAKETTGVIVLPQKQIVQPKQVGEEGSNSTSEIVGKS